ncbi:hypothetical protein [Nostoc sphaeroides]|uniref:Uncharacterized protein n=1 Tax=Nostoc sphaeroides CCNUC1 TaxID=2653204 RepID=A0A5P8WEG4_9NOSO|nr:hypothetical protein [Nostoc sphaeroides]QFS50990.1 hypothetical protein GXM_08484 [Nostoc sphaeroides CCNUC1]
MNARIHEWLARFCTVAQIENSTQSHALGYCILSMAKQSELVSWLVVTKNNLDAFAMKSPHFNSFLPAHPKNTIATVLLTQPLLITECPVSS